MGPSICPVSSCRPPIQTHQLPRRRWPRLHRYRCPHTHLSDREVGAPERPCHQRVRLGQGSVAAAPPQPPQPPGKGGAKEWIKKQLQSLGRILAKLAGKAAAALPGIIGSIVSWLLSLLGKTAVWLSSNLWAVLLAVGGLLLVAARECLLPKKPKQS